MKFIDVVEQTKNLARESTREDRALTRTAAGKDPDPYEEDEEPFMIPMETAVNIMRMEHPKRQALQDYLLSLEPRTLGKLASLMYSGRESEDIRDFLKTQDNHSQADCAQLLSGKKQTAEYLQAGVEQARKRGIDLESL